jgi:hypothetical protein
MDVLRYEAAKQLEQAGWALVRYAQRTLRACADPSAEHEASALEWYQRARSRIAAFMGARLAWKSGVVSQWADWATRTVYVKDNAPVVHTHQPALDYETELQELQEIGEAWKEMCQANVGPDYRRQDAAHRRLVELGQIEPGKFV